MQLEKMAPEKMKTDLTENITISAQSSIRIAGERIIYFDPYRIAGEPHDADFIFITHAHSDHFSPEEIKAENLLRMNMPIDVVQKGTGLSIEKIGEIRNFLSGEAGTKTSLD